MNKSYLDIFYNEKMNNFLVKEFEKKIFYVSEKIESYERIYSEEEIIGVRLILHDQYSENSIRERINEILENEIIGLKNIRINRIWDDDELLCADSQKVLNECIEEKLLIIPNEGQVILKNSLVDLFEFFDNVFKIISINLHSCENYRFPTLLKNSTLKKVGYFESFPNLLMFVVRLKNEIDNYKGFKKEFINADNEKITEKLLDYSCNSEFGLPPTMCYYVYEMLANQEIDNYAVTAVGKSFRYENKYYKPFERLWDFTIRETVFLGEYEFVRKQVESYRSYAIRFMKLLNLHGFCETANDPFFLVDNVTKKINIQKMVGSKYELRLRINTENTMAIGSFNIHGQFLAKRFKLFQKKSPKKFCYTGCIGIGIERLLFGFLAQYGCDQNNWPKIVKEWLKDRSYISNIIFKLCEDNK